MVTTNTERTGEYLHFQGRDNQEKFQFYCRQHWIRLLWPFCRTVFWTLVILGAGWVMFFYLGVKDPFTRHGLLLGLFLILTMVYMRLLFCFYTYFLHVVVVTDRKVHRIKKTLFSIDDHLSIDIPMFQDVVKQQHGIVQNVFGYGTLILEAQDSEMRLHFIPHISVIHQRLAQIRERAREQQMMQNSVQK